MAGWGLRRVLKAQLTDKPLYCSSFPNLLHATLQYYIHPSHPQDFFFFNLPCLKASYRPYLILKSKDINWVENGNNASNSVLSAVLFPLSGHLSAPASQNRGLNTYFSVLHPGPPLTRYQWHITQWIKCESHNTSPHSVSEQEQVYARDFFDIYCLS